MESAVLRSMSHQPEYDGAHSDVQAIVDAAARAGRADVELPAGTYLMRNALQLRSGLRIHGAGAGKTTLVKAPSRTWSLQHYIGYGQSEFTVEDPAGLEVGMGVHLYDDNAWGFYSTTATIVARRGNRFYIDRPLAHDYAPQHHGKVTTTHALVEGVGIQDASIDGVKIDGYKDEEAFALNGCRGSGAHLHECHRVQFIDLEVMSFRGEGIGFQSCTDVLVKGCHVHHNTGSGLHPGAGSVRYVLIDNESDHNGEDGIFYCLRTTHSVLAGNQLHHNGRHGISIGECDCDHLVIDNTVAHHREAGICMRPPFVQGGDRCHLERNHLHHNGAAEGAAQIEVAGGLTSVHLIDNHIAGDFTPMRVDEGSRDLVSLQNSWNDQPLTRHDIVGDANSVNMDCDQAHEALAVGPEAAAPEDGLHLRVRLGEIPDFLRQPFKAAAHSKG